MRIYLDHNATTPLDAAVAEVTTRVARDVWGNASSVHHFGQQAKAVLDEARGQVAELIGAEAAYSAPCARGPASRCGGAISMPSWLPTVRR